MKAKSIAALGVFIVTVLAVVMMTVSPERSGSHEGQPVPAGPVQEIAAGPPAEPESVAAEAVTAAPASPLPSKEEQSAIEARIRSTVYPRPAWERIKGWWHNGSGEPQSSKVDYETTRGLYLRFLDNFTRIKTARFRVETFKILGDGSQVPEKAEDIVWTAEKRRLTTTRFGSPEKPETEICISDGETSCTWRDGKKVESRAATRLGISTVVDNYLFVNYSSAMLERHPRFLNHYTTCEIDNGSTGYSRLWDVFKVETRFDTATGLLTEERNDYSRQAYTYQNVGGLWFLGEDVYTHEHGGTRQVFSEVVLNEPVDEALFDVDNPG